MTHKNIEFDTFISDPSNRNKELKVRVKSYLDIYDNGIGANIYRLDEVNGLYICINNQLKPEEMEAIITQIEEHLKN